MAEIGVRGVVLQAGILEARLGDLLDACLISGIEAFVEVNSMEEADFALSLGAGAFIVNLRDPLTGEVDYEKVRKRK